MKLKLVIEYHGAEFSGWQFQPGQRTVESVLAETLTVYFKSQAKKLGVELERPVTLTASGRTDSGVHARGQVVNLRWPEHFEFDQYRMLAALNGIAPRDLGVRAAELVPDSFDARMAPHVKCYRYTLQLRTFRGPMMADRAWHVFFPLDIAAMVLAARQFAGTHDFKSFQSADCHAKTTVRTVVASELTRVDDQTVVFSVQGKGFLKNMVRTLVGTLVEVGRGKIAPEEMGNLIEAKDRTKAGPRAPAHGLCLEWVHYL